MNSFITAMRKYLLLLLCAMALQTVTGQIRVTGVVMDGEFGGPLPEATVKIKGIKKVSQTDIYGNFSVKCKKTDTLEILYMGYLTNKQIVGSKTKFEIILKHKCETIPEILIQGIIPPRIYDGTGKPVIYLYPPTQTEVSLKVNYNGKMETTYPEYNGGWNVIANPDGTLHNKADGKEYSYLFWDGIKQYTKAELSYEQGFVVAADTALQFLQNVLPQMGLTPREYNEFIVYWLPFLQKHALNFVHFRVGNAYNVISQNEVSPAPNTEIRVFMEFQAINSLIDVAPQHFTKPTRKGFTLVEWGGTEIKDEIFITPAKGQVTATGTILDGFGPKRGEPLPGAIVKIKGTTRRTQTNINGQFSINCNKTDTLEISGCGYDTKLFEVGNRTKFDYMLQETCK